MCLTAAGGCMSQPRVVSMDRETGAGTVAVPSGTDVWPFYYRREALALIEKQVGPNYKITFEGDVPTGGVVTQNTQQTTTEQTTNPRNPNQTGQQQTTSGAFFQQNLTEYRISFVRMPPPAGTNLNNINRLSPTGGTGAGQGLIQPTGGVGAGSMGGVVPSVLPNNNGNVGPAGVGARWSGPNN
jgi:hypothetical protein